MSVTIPVVAETALPIAMASAFSKMLPELDVMDPVFEIDEP